MASARITGCAVQVESAPDTPSGTRYTISGEGAARLHELCEQNAMRPSPLSNGTFTQRTIDIDYTQSNAQTCFLRDALRDAAAATIQR